MARCGQSGGLLKGRMGLRLCKLFSTSSLGSLPAYRVCASIPKLIPLCHVLYWLSKKVKRDLRGFQSCENEKRDFNMPKHGKRSRQSKQVRKIIQIIMLHAYRLAEE